MPETGEADVDEKVCTTSGDEENTDRWDCREVESALGRDKGRRRRARTEDGDDNDEDGGEWVGHFDRGR